MCFCIIYFHHLGYNNNHSLKTPELCVFNYLDSFQKTMEDDISKLLKAESLCLDSSSDSKLTPLEAVLQVK